MARQRIAEIRAGDTEPLEITIDAVDLDDLAEFASGALYARKSGASTNHVDGAEVTVADSAAKTVRFDPVGAGPAGADAFGIGDEGSYDVYVQITWSDGDETRHPGGTPLRLVVTESWEE